MSINLSATTHLLELVTTGTGAVHVAASFIDDNAGTKTGGSQTTIISSATTTTIVSAPTGSIIRSIHHISIEAVGANGVTVQKDVSATDVVLIGSISLGLGERLEFTSSYGWRRITATGAVSVGFNTIAADSFVINGTGSAAVPTAVAGSTVAGAGLTYTTGGILAVGTGSGITVNANDVSISDNAITPSKLGVIASNVGPMFTIYSAFTAGGGGSPADFSIFTSDAPFNFRILEVIIYTSTAVGSSTVTLRTATGGGGSALSSAISTAVTGQTSNNNTATVTVSAGGSLVLRKSDSGIAGEIIILGVKL